jgi:hypothetical protein
MSRMLLALLGLALFAAPATAGPVFSIDQPKTPPIMAWDGDGVEVQVQWHFDWATQGSQVFGAADREAELVWEADCEGALSAVAPPNTTIDLWPGYPASVPAQHITGTSVGRLLPLPESPGEEPQVCLFRGKVTPKATGEESNWAAVEVLGTVAFRGRVGLEAVRDEPVGVLRVTNLGNAAADLEFHVEGANGWRVTPRETPALAAPGTKPPLNLTFDVTGPGGSLDGLDLVVTPRSTKDPEAAGEPARIPLASLVDAKAAKVQGAPAPTAGVLLALAVCALAVARRRAP